jgi:hypothetical protein
MLTNLETPKQLCYTKDILSCQIEILKNAGQVDFVDINFSDS